MESQSPFTTHLPPTTEWILLLGKGRVVTRLEQILQARGYQVSTCDHVPDMVSAIDKYPAPPSLIMTTLAVLEASGHIIHHNLALLQLATPIIAVIRERQTRRFIYNLGAVDYIALPLLEAEIVARVGLHLAQTSVPPSHPVEPATIAAEQQRHPPDVIAAQETHDTYYFLNPISHVRRILKQIPNPTGMVFLNYTMLNQQEASQLIEDSEQAVIVAGYEMLAALYNHDEVQRVLQDCVATGAARGKLHSDAVDGSKKHYQVIASHCAMAPVRDATLTQDYVFLLIVEDTWQQILQQQRWQEKVFLQHLPLGVQFFDATGTVRFMNSTAATLLGLAANEGLAHYNILQSDYAQRMGMEAAFQQALAGKMVKTEPFQYTPNKTVAAQREPLTRLLELSYFPIKSMQGDVVNVVMLINDISRADAHNQQRDTDIALLRGFIQALPMMVSIVDKQERYCHVNAARASLINLSPSMMEGNHYADFYPDRIVQRWRADDTQIFAGRKMEFESTLAGVPRHIYTFPISNPSNEIIAKGMIAVDISQLDHKTRELEQAQILIHKARASKRHLLEDVSHELRTPLTAILGFSDMLMLEAESLSEDARNHIQAIQNNSHELLRAFNSLLEKAHRKPENIPVNLVVFPLETVLANILQAMEEKCQRRHIVLSVDMETGLPAYVRGDVAKFKEILRYILINVITFGEQETLDIRIYGKQQQSSLLLSVHISDRSQALSYLADDVAAATMPHGSRFSTHPADDDNTVGFALYRHVSQLMGGSLRILPHEDEIAGNVIAISLPFTVIPEQEQVGELIEELKVLRQHSVSILYNYAMEVDRQKILDFCTALQAQSADVLKDWSKVEELLQYFVSQNDYASIVNACEAILQAE